ncbi:RNA polymerase sigma24 factor [Agromyces luteolus]|uniref:Sigma-70 family RNA polymerase sigma factor n=1 Tax=Agromyces luteolus TaxID=88373 RepID=A0A7C9HIN2_9MICO|nr:RNA polymerase sigma factor SigJ [Agromyces luteolus]MUN07967.1 sigma-70 family RNA polymerase sigma factor [Agromyces luteolus]GLK28020.1 RNA polymerase sigma24 factor [Agromyces luteolus]
MTTDGGDARDSLRGFDPAVLDAERGLLMSLAYRMLGTVADAEDAVQETYARWVRLSPPERDAIENPAAWLTRVVGRVCLDQLGSARARRESYVGEWLPEPLPGGAGMFAAPRSEDPLDRVTLDESVSTALLVVLESLTPAERVAFVLHDVFAVPFAEIAEIVGRSPEACRQLASSARRHVRERRSGAATREHHDEVVRAFMAAAATGALDELLAVLDPDVRLVSDGGGLASAAIRPVLGGDHVARFILGLKEKRGPALELSVAETADGLTLAMGEGGAIDSVLIADVRGDRIATIWIMRNPEKLRLWNSPG